MGNRKVVLVTSYMLNDVLQEGVVAVDHSIHRFARRHSRQVRVVEWGAYAASHQWIFNASGVHFTTRGYLKRTKVIVRKTKHIMRNLRDR